MKTKAIVTAGIIATTLLAIAGLSDASTLASVLTSLIWIWE